MVLKGSGSLRTGWMRDHGYLRPEPARDRPQRTRQFDAEDAGLFAHNPVASVHVPLARPVDPHRRG
ncbi:MAG: hypothetical protein U0992_22925 [Planctomycetaceae bacterium]